MLKLLMITALLLAPTHSFAVDLVGSAPDASGVAATAIVLEEVFENGKTRLIGKGAWGPALPGEPESPWGNADGSESSAATKIKVTVKSAGVAVGTFTSEPMSVDDALRMMDASNTLNDYLKKGGKLSLNANPSPLDLSKAVQKLESSKDPEVLKTFYMSQMDNLKESLDNLKEKYKTCREDRKAALREKRDGKPLPKRAVEFQGTVLPPVIGPGSSAK